MKIQDDDYSCGAVSLLNAIRCFDERVSPRLVKNYASTDEVYGTDDEGIVVALSKLGYAGKAEKFMTGTEAMERLLDCLANGRPCIMAVDNDTHFVVAIGLIGEKVIVFDSTNTLKNISENGVHILNKKKIMKRWRNKSGEFYYIEVIKK